jgi:hypothetical protein
VEEAAGTGKCRELTPSKRNRYFTGKLLTATDLAAEQSYHQEKALRHNRYLHGYGVVCGLRVVPAQDRGDLALIVEPGLAVDAWGREIVVAEPAALDLGEWISQEQREDSDRPLSILVVVEYAEAEVEPVPVPAAPPAELGEAIAPSRTVETFRLGLRSEAERPEAGGEGPLWELVAEAVQHGADAERLREILCETFSRPCPPCQADPAVTLARVKLPARGPLTREAIDNCSHRRLLLNTDHLLQVVLGLLAGLADANQES